MPCNALATVSAQLGAEIAPALATAESRAALVAALNAVITDRFAKVKPRVNQDTPAVISIYYEPFVRVRLNSAGEVDVIALSGTVRREALEAVKAAIAARVAALAALIAQGRAAGAVANAVKGVKSMTRAANGAIVLEVKL